MIGKTIRQYQIIEKLGEGGMGTVYKAEDTTLNRIVAIKQLSRELSESEEARARFIREAQAASSLNHPNITTVYEFFEEDGEQYICMECVDGETLREKVKAGPIHVEEAVSIIQQVARALRESHDKGILHRDVKSANIMVKRDGTAKIMDFGLAYLEERSQLTRTGTTLGTISYSSPEQIIGGPLDGRNDIFALGVVFYELLASELPFKGSSEAEILYAIINTAPKNLTEIREDVPAGLEAVVEQMLEKEAENRYEDCQKLIEDLDKLEAGFSTGTTVFSTTAEIARTKRRRLSFLLRLAIGAGIAGIVITVGYAIGRSLIRLDPDVVVIAGFLNNTGDTGLDDLSIQLGNGLSQDLDAFVGSIPDKINVRIVHFGRSQDFISSRLQQEQDQNTYRVLRRLARKHRAGAVILGTYSTEGADLRIDVDLYDYRGRRTINHIKEVAGNRTNISLLLDELSDRVSAALGVLFNRTLGEQMEFINIPRTWGAYINFYRGHSSFNAPSREAQIQGLQYLYRANEEDPEFVYPLLLAAYIHFNNARFAQVDSIVQVVESKTSIGEVDRKYMMDVRSNTDGQPRNRYRSALEAAELCRYESRFWNGSAGIIARVLNLPRQFIKLRRRNKGLDNFGRAEMDDDQRRANDHFHLTPALHMLGKHRKELREAEFALHYAPESTYSNESFVRALIGLGRINDAIIALRNVFSIVSNEFNDPMDIVLYCVCEMITHGFAEEADAFLKDEVIPWFRDERADLDRDSRQYREKLAFALYCSDELQDAEEIYQELVREFSGAYDYWSYLGTIAARQGNREEAQRIKAQIASMDDPYLLGSHTYRCARIAAQLEDKEEAVRLLKQAYREGYLFTMNILDEERLFGIGILRDIDLLPLYDYPAFQDWMRPKRGIGDN